MTQVSAGIFLAAIYADIFDYPLTKQELTLWSISTPHQLRKSYQLKKEVFGGTAYLVLPGRSGIGMRRAERKLVALSKWASARHIATLISIIPTIELVGITGGLAVNNTKDVDDIDFFFVTTPGTIWISRLLVTIICELAGVRRKPTDKHVQDKVCLNMFVSAESLAIPTKERDLFSAHEVLQMQPVIERNAVYKKFINENNWVDAYLPNAKKVIKERNVRQKKQSQLLIRLIALIENPAKIFQLWYMKNRRSSEVVSDSVLRFHPKDARIWVYKKFRLRLEKMNVPLDNIFYRG